MIDSNIYDVWGLRTPPVWARRALEKGIIDERRFHALVRVAVDDAAPPRRGARHSNCSCRRRPPRACTRWRS